MAASIRFSTRVIVLCCLVQQTVSLPGCATPAQERSGVITKDITHVPDLVAVLRKNLPDGSSAADAKVLMEREGFACRREHGTFYYKVVNNDGSSTAEEITDSDFLFCRRDHQDGWVTTVTTIAVFLDDDKVVDIKGKREFIGP